MRDLAEALSYAHAQGAALERLEIACHRGGRSEEALAARCAWLGQRQLADHSPHAAFGVAVLWTRRCQS